MPAVIEAKPATRRRSLRYALVPERCAAEFAVRHHVLATVRGRVPAVAGTLSAAAEPGMSWVRVDLDATRADTGDTERDALLRDHMLRASEHPVLRFESTEVHPTSATTLDVFGDLYLAGAVGEVLLRARVVRADEDRVVVAATGSLSRSAFDLTWDPALERVGIAVSDRVRLTVAAEFAR
jgi:polyisoprenoid-binding protein YceI